MIRLLLWPPKLVSRAALGRPDHRLTLNANPAEEAQAALAALSLQPPPDTTAVQDSTADETYVTEATATSLPKPAPQGILKNASKLPTTKAKMTIKERKAREVREPAKALAPVIEESM